MTVAELRELIRARGFEADTDAQQLSFLSTVERRLAALPHRWSWTLASGTIVLVAGTAAYALPAGVVQVESMRYTVGASAFELEWMDPDKLREALAESEGRGGAALHWSRTGPRIVSFWPVPSAAGIVNVTYRIRPPVLTGDASTPILPEAYQDILVVGACELMAQRERAWDSAKAFAVERAELTRALVIDDVIDQRQTPLTIAQSGFYGTTY